MFLFSHSQNLIGTILREAKWSRMLSSEINVSCNFYISFLYGSLQLVKKFISENPHKAAY